MTTCQKLHRCILHDIQRGYSILSMLVEIRLVYAYDGNKEFQPYLRCFSVHATTPLN